MAFKPRKPLDNQYCLLMSKLITVLQTNQNSRNISKMIICSSSQFFTQTDTLSLCINSMEEDQFFVIICFYIKKDRPAPLSSHHQLHANTEHASGRNFVSLPILHKDFVLAYMGISGVSRLSALISLVQRLIEKRISQHQVAERMDIHTEQEHWSHLLWPFC